MYIPITVSSTVVAVGASAQVEIVKVAVADGVNLYHMLRESCGVQGVGEHTVHEGTGGSPAVVASVMSAVVAVR